MSNVQEHKEEIRKASGAVVYRYHKGDLQFLLVRSTSDTEWVFPKGGLEPDLSKRGNAIKEVYEEAGVLGIVGERITCYQFTKGGQRQEVTMFIMECVHQIPEAEYPEGGMRKRRWEAPMLSRQLLPKYLRCVFDQALDIIKAL